ncbi:MAG: hypothetical protein ACE37F_22590 [Nannocystaceae bacterium]|nr:hypothetical protein [bacterium]
MTNRRFLFSLLLLPACEPAVSDNDDPRVPDGGDPEKFEESCRDFYGSYLSCYEDAGYTYDTGSYDSEGYDPAEYIEAICNSSEEYAQEYGTACVGALEEVFACMSSLDCAEVIGDDSGDANAWVPEACRAVYESAVDRCPELLSQCGTVGVGGFEGCSVEMSGCLDGNTYAVDCDEGGATQSCVCQVNGEVTAEATVSGDLECFGEGWGTELEAACGFPRGTL